MNSSRLLVYKASAGSGKTFTLAAEYIKLLVRNPRAYRYILAVTFTNKATTEMKSRILEQLYGIWTEDKDSEPYLRTVCRGLRMKESDVRAAAGIALNNLIHDYSNFRVETIDSFFQSIVRNLARELELSTNLNVELNSTEVLSEAVDSMIEKLDRRSPVLLWLLDYIKERIESDKRWNVSNEVKNFGRNIFDEEYVERGEGLRSKLKDKDYIRNYRKKIEVIRTECLEQMKSFADQFFGVLEEAGFSPADLAYGTSGVCGYFLNLQKGNLTDKIVGARVMKGMESEESWAIKKSSCRKEILSLASTQLMDILKTAENFRSKNNRLINSCDLSLHHINKVRLLTNIDEEVRELNRENNRFLLSDTNALLHSFVKDGDSSFIFEKIGANIRTVMIDEFQDTSRMQWSNFRLLLLEGLSQGYNSLIVGDVKQSIYRWRNGDWSILNNLKDKIEAFPIQVENLTVNRRSEANIIRFNNRIFTAACDYLSALYQKELGKECSELKDAYKDVCQESPKKEEKGFVKISFVEGDEEKNYQEEMLENVATQVQELVASGIKLSDITILVRKNKNIPVIADYFDKHLSYKIVSDEAFRLDASLAVCLIIDGIRYLTNPEDIIAKAQLATDYQNEILGNRIDTNTLLLNEIDAYLPETFVNRIDTLRLTPLYELTEELFSVFEMERINGQDAYLFAFYDSITEYLQANPSDLDSFLTFWEERLHSKTIPSGEIEGIRVLSIHKSKGLEFHTVLLPFCDWKMENETFQQLVWCTPAEPPFNELDLVPVNYCSSMAQSIYCNEYLHERLQLWVDNLNLLYVAFTRAAKNLFILGKAATKNRKKTDSHEEKNNVKAKDLSEEKSEGRSGQKGTVSELLFQALLDVSARYQHGWTGEGDYEFGMLCRSKEKKEKQSTNKLAALPKRQMVKMEYHHHEIKFLQTNRSHDFTRQEEENENDKKYIKQGRLLHILFSRIRTKQDILPAIERLVFEGIIESKQQEIQIRKLTERVFSHPKVIDWYSGEWQLFNECTIVYKENETTATRRPDRVMVKDDTVIVVDFKFGTHKPGYAEQVKGYMKLLSRMKYKHIIGYIWYVYENKLEEIKTGN